MKNLKHIILYIFHSWKTWQYYRKYLPETERWSMQLPYHHMRHWRLSVGQPLSASNGDKAVLITFSISYDDKAVVLTTLPFLYHSRSTTAQSDDAAVSDHRTPFWRWNFSSPFRLLPHPSPQDDSGMQHQYFTLICQRCLSLDLAEPVT